MIERYRLKFSKPVLTEEPLLRGYDDQKQRTSEGYHEGLLLFAAAATSRGMPAVFTTVPPLIHRHCLKVANDSILVVPGQGITGLATYLTCTKCRYQSTNKDVLPILSIKFFWIRSKRIKNFAAYQASLF